MKFKALQLNEALEIKGRYGGGGGRKTEARARGRGLAAGFAFGFAGFRTEVFLVFLQFLFL